MSFTYYMGNLATEHFLRNNSQTAPSNLYLAIYMDEPGLDGSGNECSASGYSRQEITFGEGYNGYGALAGYPYKGIQTIGGYTYYPYFYANSNEITFETTDDNFGGDIDYLAIFDAASGGNMLMYLSTGDIDKGDFSLSLETYGGNKLGFPIESIWNYDPFFGKGDGTTDYYYYLIVEHFFRNNAQSPISASIALLTTGKVEVTGTGYSRENNTFGPLSETGFGPVANSASMAFVATDTWESFSRAAIVNAGEAIDLSTSTVNVLYDFNLGTSYNLNATSPTTFTFTSGNFGILMSG